MVSLWWSVWTSLCHTSVFSFPDNNLSKYQWIFTKLGMCIDVVWVRFWVANGQIFSILDRVICPPHDTTDIIVS